MAIGYSRYSTKLNLLWLQPSNRIQIADALEWNSESAGKANGKARGCSRRLFSKSLVHLGKMVRPKTAILCGKLGLKLPSNPSEGRTKVKPMLWLPSASAKTTVFNGKMVRLGRFELPTSCFGGT